MYRELIWLLLCVYDALPGYLSLSDSLFNEPHSLASWGNSNSSTDFNHFAERAIDYLSSSFPTWHGLFLVEGVQFNQDCDPGDCTKYPEWWGGGFDGAKKVRMARIHHSECAKALKMYELVLRVCLCSK